MAASDRVPAVMHEARSWRVGPLEFRLVPHGHPSADVEPVLGLIALAFVAALLLLPLEAVSDVLGVCQFHAFTGFPCLTCGATRAVLALGRGDLALALRMNPLIASTIVGAALWSPLAVTLWLLRAPRPRLALSGRRAGWIAGGAAVLLVIAQWVFLVLDGR